MIMQNIIYIININVDILFFVRVLKMSGLRISILIDLVGQGATSSAACRLRAVIPSENLL